METNPCIVKLICFYLIKRVESAFALSFYWVISMGELGLAWDMARRSLSTAPTGALQSLFCTEML